MQEQYYLRVTYKTYGNPIIGVAADVVVVIYPSLKGDGEEMVALAILPHIPFEGIGEVFRLLVDLIVKIAGIRREFVENTLGTGVSKIIPSEAIPALLQALEENGFHVRRTTASAEQISTIFAAASWLAVE